MSSITCPKCSSKLKLDEIVPGKTLTCSRCRRRLRVNESGTAAVVDLPGPGAAKAESQTIRPAESEPPRKKVARGFSGWAIYGAIGTVICLLLLFIWAGTSRTTPTKTPARSGASLFAEQSAPPETVSSPTEPTPASQPAPRKELRSRDASDRKKTNEDSTGPQQSPERLLIKSKLAAAASKSDVSHPRAAPIEAAPKEEPVPVTAPSKEVAAAPAPGSIELADALPGNLDASVAKTIDEWKKASADFEAEKAATTGAKKLKSLLGRDPARQFSSNLLDLGEKQPNSTTGFQAFVAALYVLRDSDPGVTGDLIARAAKHVTDHFGDPGMGMIALLAAPLPHPAVRHLVQTVLDKNQRPDEKGLACFALIKNLKAERDQTLDPAAIRRIDKQARALVRRIETQEFGNVTVGDLPLADALNALAASTNTQLKPGTQAPEIVGKDLDGHRLRLSDYRGKVVMLQFWAGWCPHCRKLAPYERELVTRMRDRPFALLGVNADKKADAALIARKKLTNWRSWQDGPSGPIGAKFQVQGYPTVFLLDRKGTIRYVGSASNTEFYDQLIEKVLAEGDAKADSKSATPD